MKTLRECIQEAEEKKVALGHFNISNIETLWGIFRAAEEINTPVIIGLSEGERSFVGVRQAKALVDSIRDEYDYPIFLNADHSYSFERFKEAIDARYNSAIYDGAKLPLEQNIQETKKCVTYARSVDPEIVVEGELGYIGTSSELITELPSGVTPESMTKPEEAKRFVDETGVDLFAPSVGNIHGMLIGAQSPALDIERIWAIKEATQIPLVLHGGSGTTDGDFKKAVAAGISIVHINTEIRAGYKDALAASLSNNPNEVAPYKLLTPVVEEVKRITLKNLKVFNNL